MVTTQAIPPQMSFPEEIVSFADETQTHRAHCQWPNESERIDLAKARDTTPSDLMSKAQTSYSVVD